MGRDIINIKGTRNGLVICLDSNHEFEDLKRTLKTKIESAKGFFKGAKFTFYLGINTLTAEKTKELEDICCEHGLVPAHPEIKWPSSQEAEAPELKKPHVTVEKKVPYFSETGLYDYEKMPCLLVNKSLRSGQKISYNGNVIILGDINPGSEVVATGDVVVMGSLRGTVHAGVNNNDTATIVAFKMDPTQLRISSTISRPPENNLACGYPEIAYLQNGQMFIKPYVTNGLKYSC